LSNKQGHFRGGSKKAIQSIDTEQTRLATQMPEFLKTVPAPIVQIKDGTDTSTFWDKWGTVDLGLTFPVTKAFVSVTINWVWDWDVEANNRRSRVVGVFLPLRTADTMTITENPPREATVKISAPDWAGGVVGVESWQSMLMPSAATSDFRVGEARQVWCDIRDSHLYYMPFNQTYSQEAAATSTTVGNLTEVDITIRLLGYIRDLGENT